MEKVNRTAFAVFLISILPMFANAQDVTEPTDIATTEALIDSHKHKHNALKDRSFTEAAKLSISETATTLSTEYEKLHKELSSQYANFSAWGSVGLTAFRIAKDIKDAYPLIVSFTKNLKYVTNIYVLKEYLDTAEAIRIQCNYLSAIAKKIPLLKANAKEISDVLFSLQQRISAITYYLRSCNFMVIGYMALQRNTPKSNPIDKARIATQIIKEYSK